LRENRFGIFLSTSFSWDQIVGFTQRCENLGYDTVYLSDHVILGSHPEEMATPRLEVLTTIAGLAAITKKVRFGELVLCNNFRNPTLVAKIGATIDVISSGRFELGIGAGWHRLEHKSYGFPFPEHSVRLEQLAEGVEIIKRMWTQKSPSFEGEHFKIKNAYCEPKPLQIPRPRITIGGSGDKILRLVAEHADQCNFGGNSLDWYEERLDTLNKYCEEAGRRFDDIEKSYVSLIAMVYPTEEELVKGLKKAYSTEEREEGFEEWLEESYQEELGYGFKIRKRLAFAGTVDQIVERIAAYERLGVSCFMLRFGDMPRDDQMMRLFAEEVIPVSKNS